MSRSPNSLLSTSYDETFDYLFKIVLIGDCGTGKTCVVQRFKTGQYEERHGNTIGVDFSMKTVNIDGKKIKERFRTITQSYYRSANGVIIVYDITKRSTFLSIQRWIEEVRRYTTSDVILILIGNKCDLEDEREVELSEAQALCQYIPEISFVMETSAKENLNIKDIFYLLASELMEKQSNLTAEDDVNQPSITITEGQPVNNCSGCKFL